MTIDYFIYNIVRPTLKQMGMWSPAAEKLLVMIACHESAGFKYRKQISGPAISFFQIEPATFSDVWDRYLGTRQLKKSNVSQFLPNDLAPLEALATSDEFATAIARMKLYMVPAALPLVTDDEALARYAKKHWNTYLGKATPEKYLADFQHYALDEMDLVPEEWA